MDSRCERFLNNFEACFLLEIFPSIFTHTDIQFDVLKNKALEEIYCIKKIVDVKNVLKKRNAEIPLINYVKLC